MPEVYSSADVRRQLGVSQRSLDYLFERCPELEPDHVAGRRLYTADHVVRIRAALSSRQVRPEAPR